MDQSQQEHKEVLELIESGKYSAAKKLHQKHIRAWPKLILKERLLLIES